MNHVSQQFVKHVQNISSSSTLTMSYKGKLIKKWWHKFHKSLDKVLQNYDNIFIPVT